MSLDTSTVYPESSLNDVSGSLGGIVACMTSIISLWAWRGFLVLLVPVGSSPGHYDNGRNCVRVCRNCQRRFMCSNCRGSGSTTSSFFTFSSRTSRSSSLQAESMRDVWHLKQIGYSHLFVQRSQFSKSRFVQENVMTAATYEDPAQFPHYLLWLQQGSPGSRNLVQFSFERIRDTATLPRGLTDGRRIHQRA